jgi:1,4-dihydroxy-6-naphthoate synthase
VATADQFVGMYVNDWTLDLGPRGEASIRLFLQRAHAAGVVARAVPVDFVR